MIRYRNGPLKHKKAKTFQEWIGKKAERTYIKINEKFRECEFEFDWFGRR